MELLQQRLGSTEQQLQFMERQLKALVAAPASGGPSEAAQQLGLVVEQLQRVLEVKEDRIRWVTSVRALRVGRWVEGSGWRAAFIQPKV